MADSAYFVKSAPQSFHWIFLTLYRYVTVTDILKMCMTKFDGEKIFFDKLIGFLT